MKILKFARTGKRKAGDQLLEGREVALKFIVRVSVLASGMAAFLYYFFHIIRDIPAGGVGYVGITVFFLFFVGLWILFAKGYHRLVAQCLVGFYLAAALFLVIRWGFNVPQGVLMISLVIFLINNLLSSRAGIRWAIGVVFTYVAIAVLQVENVLEPKRYWVQNELHLNDALVYIGVLAIIVTIARLFNGEIERSLKRALDSEEALKEERDQLELRVEERSNQLKRAQFERVLQIHRFADIGRHAGGLLHDMVNPLTALSLRVEELYARSKDAEGEELVAISQSAKEALEATKRVERFVAAARKQIRQEELRMDFSPAEEIAQVATALAYRTRLNKVKLSLDVDETILLHGDPVKFYKVIQNLVANAVESYEDVAAKGKREVSVSFQRSEDGFVLRVQDYGSGISPAELDKIFQPFYSTKSADRGTGIGLTIVWDIIKLDLKGSIEVTSEEGAGTLFVVSFPASLAAA